MFKNVAAKFIVFAFDATTNVPKTGDAANITAYVSKDYGTVTVLGDTSATEMDATNAPGYYLFDAAQAETNADCLMVSGKSVTANIKVIGAPAVIYTRPTTGWLAPTVIARTLDVSAGGEAGVDWGNVGNPTTANGLTGTTISTTQAIASVSGAVGSVTGAVGSVTGAVGSVTGAVGSVSAGVTVTTNNDKTGYSTSDWTTQLTESYRANAAAPTPAQAMFEIIAHLGETSIAGTVKTIKKINHATTAETFTLDSATAPTSITRAT